MKKRKFYISFIMNKKRGGDKKVVYSYSDAEDIFSKAILYFSENPDKFVKRWFLNKLIQLRKNFIRDKRRESSFKAEWEDVSGEYTLEEECMRGEVSAYIEELISEESVLRNQDILRQFYLHNRKPADIITDHSNPWQVIKRFEKKMVEVLGG